MADKRARVSASGAVGKLDRRVVRTRRALLDAFRALVLEGRYDRIKVGDIAARADVGRSTFYEHFADKETLLAESIRGPFAPLVSVASARPDVDALSRALAHFREQQRQARMIFGGAARRPVERVLASMIAEQLRRRSGELRSDTPVDLASALLATALLGAVTAWLAGASNCTAPQLAELLRRIGQGVVRSLG